MGSIESVRESRFVFSGPRGRVKKGPCEERDAVLADIHSHPGEDDDDVLNYPSPNDIMHAARSDIRHVCIVNILLGGLHCYDLKPLREVDDLDTPVVGGG